MHGSHMHRLDCCTRCGEADTTFAMSSTTQIMPAYSSHERLGLLLGFVGVAIFGGTLPATRLAVSAIDPIALTAMRAAIAGLCSLVLLVVLRRPIPPRALWPQLVIAMLCVSVFFPLLMAFGMQTVDASHGGVVLGVLPIATALVAVAITMNDRDRCSGSPRSQAPRW